MPANLTPDYLAAEARYKATKDTAERIEALQEMLRVIPKHKGTDHLQGQLKRKLSQLKDELRSAPKKGARRADPGHVPAQGAGQVVLLGAANTGKSRLLAALSNAEPEVAAYPYTTQKPLPAMVLFEDAPIQLVDTLAAEPAVWQPWMNTLVRNADLALVVLDPASVGVLGYLDSLVELAALARVELVPAWWAVGKGGGEVEREQDVAGMELDDDAIMARLEPGDLRLPVLVAANKLDVGDNRAETEVLSEFLGEDWPIVAVSAETGEGLDALRRALFLGLVVIRVYTKPPGKPPSLHEPILLPRGATVRDMARAIHKEIAANLRFARIWGPGHFDGQRIPRDHVLGDGDIVEMHT